ncbi:MAG TPA: response regulator [Anditalea sp.]|nr:response regulator [Anditalea sp.]
MKILLVEDDEINRFILKKRLEKNEFIVTTANNGIEALEKLQADINFDIIMTDIMMPEMNGIELLESVKVHPIFKSIPIIGFSQGNLEHMKAKTSQSFDALFPKPLDIEKIFSTIKNFSLKN